MKIFRFDDVSICTMMSNCNAIANLLHSKFPDAEIQYAISPLVFNIETEDDIEKQRVFPKIFNALSDHRKFYEVTNLGIPQNIPYYIKIINHGLFHLDSRLLTKEQQEMNIIAGCSLTKSKIFSPPFSKYNQDTIDVCEEHGIELHKFTDGWKCFEHEDWDENNELWYLHPRLWSVEKLKKYLSI